MAKLDTQTPTVHIGQGEATPQRIVIHGHDVTDLVRSLTFDAGVGRLPRLSLELVVIETTQIESEHATVWMEPGTAELLQRAGWTPPEGRPAELLAATTEEQ